MRKKITAIALLLLSSSFIFAQRNSAKENTLSQTSFFAELGGPGILFSANIDRRFTQSHVGWGGRAGLGFVSADEYTYNPVTGYDDYNQTSALTIPVQLNYIFGKANSPHTFEVGAGATWVSKKLEIMNFYDNKETSFFGTFAFMYRRQPVNGGFSWRAGFTPIFGKNYIQPFGALSVGYNF